MKSYGKKSLYVRIEANPMTTTEPIVVNNTAEFTAALAKINADGKRISIMRAGKHNSQWILEVVDAPLKQPGLLPPRIHPAHPTVF